jgi:hypothetical protein
LVLLKQELVCDLVCDGDDDGAEQLQPPQQRPFRVMLKRKLMRKTPSLLPEDKLQFKMSLLMVTKPKNSLFHKLIQPQLLKVTKKTTKAVRLKELLLNLTKKRKTL